MNLRELKNFITYKIDDRLSECGIDVNQIEQIKIYDRQIPSNDNNLVWKLTVGKLDYLDVLAMLEDVICNEIVYCYMNNTDRDLSIEIMGNGKGMMAI